MITTSGRYLLGELDTPCSGQRRADDDDLPGSS